MDEADYLQRAHEAEILAITAQTDVERQTWDNISKEYFRLADMMAALRTTVDPRPPA